MIEIKRTPDSDGISDRLLAAYLALFFVVWSLRATVFFSLDERIQEPFCKLVYSNVLKFTLWVLPLFLLPGAGSAWKRLKITSPVNIRGLIYAAGASVLFFGGMLVINRLALGKSTDALLQAGPFVLVRVFCGALVSAGFEEVFFRGFVLSELQRHTSFSKANFIASVLFVLIHWPHWLWTQGFATIHIQNSVAILILGLFLGCLVKWSNSLWPAVFAHALNNAIASF